MTNKDNNTKKLERIFEKLEEIRQDIKLEKLVTTDKSEALWDDLMAARPQRDVEAEHRYDMMIRHIGDLHNQQRQIVDAMHIISRIIGGETQDKFDYFNLVK